MIPVTNQFSGKCVYCHGTVSAGEGLLHGRKRSGKGWDVSHAHDCLSVEEPLSNEPPSDYGDWETPSHEGEIDKDYHDKT